MNEKKRYIIALCIGLNMALGSATAMAENEQDVKSLDEQVAAAESSEGIDLESTNPRAALRPFKYTITTEKAEDYHPQWGPLWQGSWNDADFVVPVAVHR